MRASARWARSRAEASPRRMSSTWPAIPANAASASSTEATYCGSAPFVTRLVAPATLVLAGRGGRCDRTEALATGLTPVVTDIPSLGALTGGGRVGALWAAGDSASCAEALLRAARAPRDRAAVRAHFDRELSFAALGRKWNAAYQELGENRVSAG